MNVTTPAMPSTGTLRPLGIEEARITGGHWARRQAVNADNTIGHCLHWLEDLGWIANFDRAANGAPFDRAGREFSDSEVYKLAEAMAWEIGRTGAPGLETEFRRLTARIAAAQQEDGYLNTRFGNPDQEPRYSDLEWGHELYCYGHLIQAAVARLRTHGEDEFVRIARRAADHVCEVFGPGGVERVCGHAEIEVALAEFARATGETRYLEQARLFIERRGAHTLADGDFGRAYYQDDVPVREAEVLRGHAVRALYLSAGAIDVAVDTGDDVLLEAVRRQWDATLRRRTHLTGGMGSQYSDEAFGPDFALPPDRAYAESCAGIAAVMTAWRLLLATGESHYADMIERIAWNVLSGAVAPDGKAFFYANPLHHRTADEPVSGVLSHWAAGGRRAPWFDVSCCPTNLARTFAQYAVYLATADDGGIQLHQYAPSTIDTVVDGARFALTVTTAYPDDGAVLVRVEANDGGERTVSLRVPAWAEDASVTGPDGRTRPVAAGAFATVTAAFAVGDEIRLDLPIRPRWTLPDPRIDAVRGCAAVERGPVVLCVESIDLPGGADVAELAVDASTAPLERDGRVYVAANVVLERGRADPWPYGPTAADDEGKSAEVPLVPFHLRANREPASMRVWLPLA